MTAAELVEQARLAGIRVYTKNGEVKLTGKGDPDPGLMALLRANRQAITRYLTNVTEGTAAVAGTGERLKARRLWESDPTVRMVRRVMGGGKLASFSGLPPSDADNQEVMFDARQ